ncbi:antibiotic biosynthesis monooxygenase [Pseudomonas sp. UL073]|uniref:Antibiotic biosynthesis monooxygenase n=1 Tax=Zestomonas insulae TaxID=2809017 RepID=A0ABS2I8I0_9GAMM|nr:antibiotic biosynthesis monooxygenase [Pseudomonas insulae]MBM7059454.1 antibiotic biosynthesis monooxygenase [Pseudomonas insulae]
MTAHHLAYLRACHGRSAQLGAGLRDLQEPIARLPGCLAFSIEQQADTRWQLRGSWVSAEARQAFFATPLLQERLSALLRDGVLASLECQELRDG